MQKQTRNIRPTESLLLALLVLTSFFFLMELSFFIACNKAYLGDFTFISGHMHIPLSILPGLLVFVFSQLLLHFIYLFFIYCVASCLATMFKLTNNQTLLAGLLLWIFGIVAILLANQYFFPFSKFSELTRLIIPDGWVNGVLLLCTAVPLILVMLLCVLSLLRVRRVIYLVLMSMATTILFYWHQAASENRVAGATAQQPNIIIIGADSLRPNALHFFGSTNKTPFFDSFLRHAVVFDGASTPLARTFPSWIALLTGEYPKLTGIRSNLVSQKNLDTHDTLPAILKRNGYQTFYATDETRFSNMQKKEGFDQIITPPMGLNDFLIGTFNDFPLSNLILNTVVGKYLFPYNYANRPAFLTYDPNSFLKLLQPLLTHAYAKPVFLAVHFCLTHAPYSWADAPQWTTALNAYDASVEREDQQIADFYTMLNQSHLLDHAIVIIISDHGEALELPGDRLTMAQRFLPTKRFPRIIKFYPPSEDDETLSQSAGHGTDVLSWTQYHTLLGFRFYGVPISPSVRVVSGHVSLLDIKPTVLGFLHLPAPQSSGVSLASLIDSHATHVSFNRPLFLESDFSPESIRTVYPNTRQVVLEGVNFFQINPKTTRLTMKTDMEDMIIHSKQYAIIQGDWMLALYPQNPTLDLAVLINRKTGYWTFDLHSSFAQSAHASQLLHSLQIFYGNDISGTVKS